MDKKEKSAWQYFKDGFKPSAARADENVALKRQQFGNQLEEDMKQTPAERAEKVRKGFMKKVGY